MHYQILNYNELSQKSRFQSVLIAALCLYSIQRENLLKKIISVYNYVYSLYCFVLKVSPKIN